MLSIENLWFQHHGAEQPALRRISLDVRPGMFLGIIGPSGSGKSTLLRTMNGLVPHFHGGGFSGTVTIGGQDTRNVGTAELSMAVGFVSQEPESQTVFDTVVDEIAFGPENLGIPGNELQGRVASALQTLQINHLAERDVATLSGGERQRVVIAAALAMGSRLLVLDEPLSQLDPWASRDLLQTLDGLRQSGEVAIVVAEHRIDQLLPHCTHIVELQRGRSEHGIQERGATSHKMNQPATIVRLADICGWPDVPETVAEAKVMHHH
jgi:energy-coupling factor transport system ATP-binding protein